MLAVAIDLGVLGVFGRRHIVGPGQHSLDLARVDCNGAAGFGASLRVNQRRIG